MQWFFEGLETGSLFDSIGRVKSEFLGGVVLMYNEKEMRREVEKPPITRWYPL